MDTTTTAYALFNQRVDWDNQVIAAFQKSF
jgi:hypothetical protein